MHEFPAGTCVMNSGDKITDESMVYFIDTGSADVFIEGKGAHRQEDSNSSHPAVPEASGCTPHITQLTSGSPDIFVNGKPLARVGDSYGCGIELTSGASNVSAN